MSTENPRYSSLGDYLRVIRRRRLLIALITLGIFALALGRSLTQETVYTAEAQLQFRDPLADLDLVGIGGETVPELAPNQRAAANAELVTRNEVTRIVQDRLKTSLSLAGLGGAVDPRVDPQTNLVVLEASWNDPEFAADLANAYAAAAREVALRDTEQRLKRFKESLSERVQAAKENLPEPGEPPADPGLAFTIAALSQNLANVRSLEDVANPVQIAQRAETPSSPTSPNHVRAGILGLSVGLVLALLIAFVRDSLDRRVHNAQEVHDELDVPVLGRVGAMAFSHAGLVQNGHPPLHESDFEPFRVLRMNLASLNRDGHPPRSVLVTSPAAMEGKSTVSVSLASAVALAGQRVLLLECDLRRPSLATRLNISPVPGLTNFLSGAASPREILQVLDISEPRRYDGAGEAAPSKNGFAGSLVCITAGSPVPNAPELLTTDRFRDMLEKLTRAYDLVILDGSPLLAVSDPLEIAPLVDGVLVCVRAQQTTREQVRSAKSALDHLPERPTGAVLTGLRPGDESYGYYYGY